MAEPDDEREASRAYRGLPRDEPPERLDDAIRAAARREAQARPAPLVAPTGRRRWYFPVAAAAVVVLAVAVTSQVEREQAQPASEASGNALEIARQETAKKEEVPAKEPHAAPRPERRRQAQIEQRRSREEFSRDRPAREEAPAPPAAAQAPAAPAASLGAGAGALAKVTTPESELQRIAELRRQGKDEEADRALAEFRKRYPAYRIAPEMLEKVEKR
jgi:hypothetical protein